MSSKAQTGREPYKRFNWSLKTTSFIGLITGFSTISIPCISIIFTPLSFLLLSLSIVFIYTSLLSVHKLPNKQNKIFAKIARYNKVKQGIPEFKSISLCSYLPGSGIDGRLDFVTILGVVNNEFVTMFEAVGPNCTPYRFDGGLDSGGCYRRKLFACYK